MDAFLLTTPPLWALLLRPHQSFELGLYYDLNYAPVKFCDCILNACIDKICPQTYKQVLKTNSVVIPSYNKCPQDHILPWHMHTDSQGENNTSHTLSQLVALSFLCLKQQWLIINLTFTHNNRYCVTRKNWLWPWNYKIFFS